MSPKDQEPGAGTEVDAKMDQDHDGPIGTNGTVGKKGSVSQLSVQDSEGAGKKLKYPKVVFFIIGNEFCERFTYYGMRTILSIFLKNSLGLEQGTATIIYHLFCLMCYFFPVVGAIISDSWLGKFKTIAYLSIVYAIGNIVVAVASATNIGIPSMPLTFVGLILIAIGTGGIKPCVSSFGGEQFIVPQQAKQLASFFSVFYFSINAGSLISTYLTPELRTTQCLDQDTCYPIAFGVPAILMIIAIVIFFIGKPGYRIIEPKGNIIVEVFRCMGSATSNMFRSSQKKDSWLDHADDKYSPRLRNDIRAMLRVLLLFVPMPIFWALYDQQGSKWTFQANNMNGRVGSWVFKPDQMQVVNPILVMILLPLFQTVIYPLLSKMHLLRKPLQKIAAGGMLASLAFILSAIVQMQLDPTLPVEASAGLAQVRVFSSLPCNLTLTSGGADLGTISPYGFWEKTDISADGSAKLSLTVSGCASGIVPLKLTERQSVSYYLFSDDASANAMTLKWKGPFEDDLNKDAMAKTRIMYHFSDTSKSHSVVVSMDGSEKFNQDIKGDAGVFQLKDPEPGQYEVSVDGKKYDSLYLDIGGAYNVLIDETGGEINAKIVTVIAANTLSLFWQFPQYIVISIAEVLVSVTGLEFSFTQAPNSMKSVLSAAWLLTDAVGNAIIIVIEAIKIFPNAADDFFLFAGLMAAVMLLFIWLAVRYVPVEAPSSLDEDGDGSLPSTPSTTTVLAEVEKDKLEDKL